MRPVGNILGCALVAGAVVALAGCGGPDAGFDEPHGVVIWSTDERPPVLPADSPVRTDSTMFADELRNAVVVVDDDEYIVVVGDQYDVAGPPRRMAYLLRSDTSIVQLLGELDGDSNTYNGVPGRHVGAGLDRGATSVRVYGSAGVRTQPTSTDPASGQVFTFAVAAEGEILYGLHALDTAGRVTDVVGIAP